MEAQTVPPSLPPQPQQKATTSGLAIASLVCGLLGFVLLLFTGIPAIIMGHMALSRIKSSNGTIGGGGMALTGTILGYVTTFLIGIIAVLAGIATPLILKAQKAAERVNLENEIRVVASDLESYHAENERYPSASEFRAVVKLPTAQKNWKGDWTYFAETSAADQLPLLISPQIGDKAVVLWSDMDVTQEKSEQVARMIFESKLDDTVIESNQ